MSKVEPWSKNREPFTLTVLWSSPFKLPHVSGYTNSSLYGEMKTMRERQKPVEHADEHEVGFARDVVSGRHSPIPALMAMRQ